MVWKNYPLPFHDNAEPAAEAAHGGQRRRASSGRCTTSCSPTSRRSTARAWRSTPRSSASTWSKFKADLDATKYKAQIEAETQARARPWARSGTPTFFINGRKIAGAYPFETFKKIADEELAKEAGEAEARLAAPARSAGVRLFLNLLWPLPREARVCGYF